MAHSEFRNRLISLANENSGNPSGFLENLSDIHDDWHGTTPRTYGFLLFHHRLVRYFNTIVNQGWNLNLTGYTSAELQGMGVVDAPATANIDTLGELSSYSARIEGWHNTAHGRIGNATGVPMMDARQNIFFVPFWKLHLYIENRFQTCLQQYGTSVHPNQFLNVTSISGHIEAGHHSWVVRI